MKVTSYIFTSLMVLSLCQSNVWHGITPLHSTRAYVERMLGQPTPDSKAQDAADYLTRDERVFVRYSIAACNGEPSNGWNIPRGMVIELSVEPKIRSRLSDLKLDKGKFEERRDPEVLDIVYYTNLEDGISIETKEGLVTAFRYFPTTKENYLKCQSSAK